MKYRSEIDGLRALAVLPVIFYHAGFDLFRGGFVGWMFFYYQRISYHLNYHGRATDREILIDIFL